MAVSRGVRHVYTWFHSCTSVMSRISWITTRDDVKFNRKKVVFSLHSIGRTGPLSLVAPYTHWIVIHGNTEPRFITEVFNTCFLIACTNVTGFCNGCHTMHPSALGVVLSWVTRSFTGCVGSHMPTWLIIRLLSHLYSPHGRFNCAIWPPGPIKLPQVLSN